MKKHEVMEIAKNRSFNGLTLHKNAAIALKKVAETFTTKDEINVSFVNESRSIFLDMAFIQDRYKSRVAEYRDKLSWYDYKCTTKGWHGHEIHVSGYLLVTCGTFQAKFFIAELAECLTHTEYTSRTESVYAA